MSNAQNDWKTKILNLLKQSQIGLSIKNIAEELGCSRTTVSKYLDILEKEGEVFDRRLGQYRIWLHKDAKLYYDKEKAKGQKFALETYSHFLEYLETHHPELDQEGKEIGKFISERLNIEELISPDLLDFSFSRADLNSIAQYIMDLLDNTYLSMDTYEWGVPVIIEDPPIIILRLINSRFIHTPLNFHMLCGLMEDKLNYYIQKSAFRFSINVHNIDKDNGIVDIRMEIKDILKREGRR